MIRVQHSIIMKIILLVLLLDTLLVIAGYTLIPVPNGQSHQWLNCLTRRVDELTNCSLDEQHIYDCYRITQDGLCSWQTQSINMTDDLYLNARFVTKGNAIVNLMVNERSMANYSLSGDKNSIHEKIMVPYNQFSIRLQALDSPLIYLTSLHLGSVLFENCRINDGQSACLQCAQDYIIQDGECIPADCRNQTERLSVNGIQFKAFFVNGLVYQKYRAIKGPFGKCLQLKYYYLNDLDNLTSIQFFQDQSIIEQPFVAQIFYPQLNYLTDQYKIPCTYFQGANESITECVTSFSALMGTAIVFQYITSVRVVTKTLDDQLIISSQGFTVPTTCCSSLDIDVHNDVLIIQIDEFETHYNILVRQFIYDPRYTGYTREVSYSTIEANGKVYPMQVVVHLQENTTLTIAKPNATFELSDATLNISTKLLNNKPQEAQRYLSTHWANASTTRFPKVTNQGERSVQVTNSSTISSIRNEQSTQASESSQTPTTNQQERQSSKNGQQKSNEPQMDNRSRNISIIVVVGSVVLALAAVYVIRRWVIKAKLQRITPTTNVQEQMRPNQIDQQQESQVYAVLGEDQRDEGLEAL